MNFDILRSIGLPPRCVCWQYEKREGKNTKVCKNAKTGGNAMSNNPATWCTLEQAIEAYYKFSFSGVGLVLNGQDITAEDLDHCVDTSNGNIEPWARDIVTITDSYTEYSPSWTGIRILTFAQKPSGRCRKGHFEMYNNGHFVTLTGHILDDGHMTIEHRQEQIDAIHKKYLSTPGGNHNIQPRPAPELQLDDVDLIKKAANAKNGALFRSLYSGNWKGIKPSPSEATASLINMLIFWCGFDTERIDRLFRQSGLYREKWERRGVADIQWAITTFNGSTYPELLAARGCRRNAG